MYNLVCRQRRSEIGRRLEALNYKGLRADVRSGIAAQVAGPRFQQPRGSFWDILRMYNLVRPGAPQMPPTFLFLNFHQLFYF
jgi:hypothetical protein